MFIQTEATPNPATIKFIPGKPVSPGRAYDFKSEQEAGRSPLAQRLFALQGVSGVFLGSDFVSVSKSDDTDWSMLKSMILNALMQHFSLDQPVVNEEPGQDDGHAVHEDDDPIVAQIKQLIEERVRPAVMMDGGDIVFSRFDDGVVYLEMHGACSGCPSSTMTLKSGIENMLKHFVPEVMEVRPVEG